MFREGAAKNGVDERKADAIFDLMEKFAGYGFNKSHAAAYALVSYQTAWLKTHYPAEFMAAVLSSDMDNTDKVGHLPRRSASHRRHRAAAGRERFALHVRRARSAEGKRIDDVRYGLGAMKGVGQGAVENIVDARQQAARSSDLADFCQRVDMQKLNKRVLEALILSRRDGRARRRTAPA